MSSKADREYVQDVLWPELNERWDQWQMEYGSQERDLGSRGEFVGLWRKVKKIKAQVWDRVDGSLWREDLRTIIFEVVAHALLLLRDLDRELAAAKDSGEDRPYGRGELGAAPGSPGSD